MRAFCTLLALVAVSCIGTTGSKLVTFTAAAAGPADATGGAYTFTTGRGYEVTLTRARLTIGAIYLNRSVPISGGQERACILPGVYVGEVLAGRTIDVLSPAPQPFPRAGSGTADPAVTGELWLTTGDINDVSDAGVILDVEGTARRGADAFAFDGKVSIGRNRLPSTVDPARPGANPICKQRIVTPIPVALTPDEGGQLLVRIDPRAWFANVEFTDLEQVVLSPPRYRFADATEGASNVNLFHGLLSSSGPYSFTWSSKP